MFGLYRKEGSLIHALAIKAGNILDKHFTYFIQTDMKKNSNLISDLFKSALYDTIKNILLFLFAIVSANGIFTALVNWIAQYSPNISQYQIHIVFGGTILVLLFINWAVNHYSRLRPKFPKVNSDFKIKMFDILYIYESEDNMEYRKCKTLKALKDDLTQYIDKYRWTGIGSVNIRSGIEGHKISQSSDRSIYKYYTISFERTLKKKEEIDTEVIWDLEDTGKTAIPFISATIEEPTDKLRMQIMLPKEMKVHGVIKEVSHMIGAIKPILSEHDDINRDNTYLWEIDEPKLLHHYELRLQI
ncbi:MAG: hypothetical protein AB2809_12710 [Candidatus Thiodiazotropha sp.]